MKPLVATLTALVALSVAAPVATAAKEPNAVRYGSTTANGSHHVKPNPSCRFCRTAL